MKYSVACEQLFISSGQRSLWLSRLSFSSNLVRGVHARASVERRSRKLRKTRAAAWEEKISLPSRAFSNRRGHLRNSRVLLDGPRKKRDCSQSTGPRVSFRVPGRAWLVALSRKWRACSLARDYENPGASLSRFSHMTRDHWYMRARPYGFMKARSSGVETEGDTNKS